MPYTFQVPSSHSLVFLHPAALSSTMTKWNSRAIGGPLPSAYTEALHALCSLGALGYHGPTKPHSSP